MGGGGFQRKPIVTADRKSKCRDQKPSEKAYWKEKKQFRTKKFIERLRPGSRITKKKTFGAKGEVIHYPATEVSKKRGERGAKKKAIAKGGSVRPELGGGG